MFVWLSLWSKVQIVCIWSSWCHCHPEIPSSLASFKSRQVVPFWYRLTQVVLEKRPLNGCSSSRSSSNWTHHPQIMQHICYRQWWCIEYRALCHRSGTIHWSRCLCVESTVDLDRCRLCQWHRGHCMCRDLEPYTTPAVPQFTILLPFALKLSLVKWQNDCLLSVSTADTSATASWIATSSKRKFK